MKKTEGGEGGREGEGERERERARLCEFSTVYSNPDPCTHCHSDGGDRRGNPEVTSV